MTLKTDLKIKIYAGDVLVAESSDPILWQKILGVIQGGASEIDSSAVEPNSKVTDKDSNFQETPNTDEGNYLDIFAKKVGVTVAELKAACDPTEEEPFIHLDPSYWESFKKNTPGRGPKAVSPIQLSGTMLNLWFDILEKGKKPAQTDAQKVLKTISVRDKNASRALNNCEWLQNRKGKIIINPTRYSQALAVIKAYIKETKIKDES